MTTMAPTTERLAVHVTASGHVDGVAPSSSVRTHSAELWFHEDLVVKHKLPVDLGFLDFTTLARRRSACEEELRLNRRLTPDVYLGLVDIAGDDGEIVDVGLVMRRMPEARRLSRLAADGDEDLGPAIRDLARQIAVFHAAAEQPADAKDAADSTAVRQNWDDNLAVLREHPDLADPDLVASIDDRVGRYLDGRGALFADRLDRGLVRDGHGDLQSSDIFLMPDGVRVLDCLDFAPKFRVGDVLLDVSFLMMDLERLGRSDLATTFLRTYQEFTDEHHPTSLAHHFVAYRAGVRAKVRCLAADGGATANGEDVASLLALASRHLDQAACRLVLVGGLPGTGKSTVAAGLSDNLGMVWLRSDEIRKDLHGIGHDQPAPPDAYSPAATRRTYEALLGRAKDLLRLGESVVLDATWSSPEWRRLAAHVAQNNSSKLVQLHCVLPVDVAHARLRDRQGDVSDADVAVSDAMSVAPWPDAHKLLTEKPIAAVITAATERVVPARPETSVTGQPRPVPPHTKARP